MPDPQPVDVVPREVLERLCEGYSEDCTFPVALDEKIPSENVVMVHIHDLAAYALALRGVVEEFAIDLNPCEDEETPGDDEVVALPPTFTYGLFRRARALLGAD